jgi:hypothetical protein
VPGSVSIALGTQIFLVGCQLAVSVDGDVRGLVNQEVVSGPCATILKLFTKVVLNWLPFIGATSASADWRGPTVAETSRSNQYALRDMGALKLRLNGARMAGRPVVADLKAQHSLR